jgi:hypothetical protein
LFLKRRIAPGAAAYLGRTAARRRRHGWVRLHITGMGGSYILVLTAFYVDNGKSLPLWKELPQLAFWVLPSTVGIPLMVYALFRHPLSRNKLNAHPGPHQQVDLADRPDQ